MILVLTRIWLGLALCFIAGCAALGAGPYPGSPTLTPTSYTTPAYAVSGADYYAPNVDYYSAYRNEALMNDMSREAVRSGGFHGGGGRR